jgi:hypothetical protein
MNEELDYAEMLEIPVSTVNIVKKNSFFKRKAKPSDDLKDRVVESVNERVGSSYDGVTYGDYVRTENLSEEVKEEKPEKAERSKANGGKAGMILFAETIAACLIAGGIFLTNIFMPSSAINTFIGNLTAVKATEAAYNEFTLTSPVSELSDAEVMLSSDGVICFTSKTLVYPVCNGEVTSVGYDNGLYSVKIAHTSTFSSVVTGLTTVYSEVGDDVSSNIPFAYSGGENEVRVSMYDGETLLNCYTLSGVVPVWNS